MADAIGLNLGMRTRWSGWGIDIRYSASRLYELDGVDLNSSCHTLSLIIGL